MTDATPPPIEDNVHHANQLGPDRARPGEARTRSVIKGDVPQSVLDRYLVERDLRGRSERFYRDHRASDPAFRDEGRKLSADRPYPDTIADMLKVAQHRGWSRLKVEGEEAFRREVWIQARALGLEVAGYSARSRDAQAAGMPDRRAELEDRVRKASIVVRALIADPEAQQRLIAFAAAKAGLDRLRRDAEPARGDGRERERVGR